MHTNTHKNKQTQKVEGSMINVFNVFNKVIFWLQLRNSENKEERKKKRKNKDEVKNELVRSLVVGDVYKSEELAK